MSGHGDLCHVIEFVWVHRCLNFEGHGVTDSSGRRIEEVSSEYN